MRLLPLIASIALATAALASHAGVVIVNNNLLVNGDFESSNVGNGSYKYINYVATTPVAATGWTFSGKTGVANHSNAWGGAATGSSVAFLQSVASLEIPVLSQTFSGIFSAVTIDFTAAQRPGNRESLRVLFDGVDLTPLLLTPTGSNWTSYTLTAANLIGSSHTLSFVGVNPLNSADSSLFLDRISVTANAEVPEPGSLALVGAALAGLGLVRRRLRG